MLIYERKQESDNSDLVTEMRVYFDSDSKGVILYQYKFKHEKVVDINCVQLPIEQFGPLTKSVLKAYVSQYVL